MVWIHRNSISVQVMHSGLNVECKNNLDNLNWNVLGSLSLSESFFPFFFNYTLVVKDHARKGDKQKLPSPLPHLFNCIFVMVPYPSILHTIGLIPFRISLFINTMLYLCNFLCIVCDVFVWANQLKSHYLCPEIGNNSDLISWWWWWWWWLLLLFNVSHYFSFYLYR